MNDLSSGCGVGMTVELKYDLNGVRSGGWNGKVEECDRHENNRMD